MFKKLKIWREERGIQNTVGNIELNIYEELLELMGLPKDLIRDLKLDFEKNILPFAYEMPITDKIDALDDLRVFSVNAIEAYGYDAEKTMDETIKEISSRAGAYNETTQKWEKFKTDEAKALWYKADYSKCKRL